MYRHLFFVDPNWISFLYGVYCTACVCVSVCYSERIGSLQLELCECCHDSPNPQLSTSQTVVFLRNMTPRLARDFILTSVGRLQG